MLLPEYVWEDRFSGEDAQDRAGFMAVVEFCRRHPRPKWRPCYVLVLNDSRFGRFRDPDEAAHWRFVLAQSGWLVPFAENDDTEHPTTRHVMRAIGGAQASEYLAVLRANAKRGTRGAAEKGLWQNEAPFGYRRVATAPGREPVVLEPGQRKSDDQVVRLTPGPPEEVKLVRWMFQTYADGLLPLAFSGDLRTAGLSSTAIRLLLTGPQRELVAGCGPTALDALKACLWTRGNLKPSDGGAPAEVERFARVATGAGARQVFLEPVATGADEAAGALLHATTTFGALGAFKVATGARSGAAASQGDRLFVEAGSDVTEVVDQLGQRFAGREIRWNEKRGRQRCDGICSSTRLYVQPSLF